MWSSVEFIIRKVVLYITRLDGPAATPQLLVFDHADHPAAGTQVPAGTVGNDEDVAEALRDFERARRRPYGPDLRDPANGGDRHVFPIESYDVDAASEAGEFPMVVEIAHDDVCDGGARHVGAAVIHREIEPERNSGKGHHPAELTGADDADAHGDFLADGRIGLCQHVRGLAFAK